MSPPRVVAVAPASPAERAGIAAGDEVLRLNGEVPRDILRWRLLADEPEVEIDLRRGGLELTLTVEKRAGEPLGAEVASALFDQVRTCDNHCEFCFIYQLPPGLRSQPLPEGRRLPAVVPVRELHDADPLHRGRPGAGGRRGALAAPRQHPRHRPRGAQPDAPQPPGRHQPALAAGAARPRHHRARPGRRVPRRQRRRGAGRHARRRARPVPRAGHAVRRAARPVPVQPGARPCGRTRSAEAAAVVDAVRGLAGGVPVRARPAPGLRGGRVLPPRRPAVPARRRLRGLPDARGRHRHGPHVRARVHRPGRAGRPACRAGSSPGSTARRPRATARPATRRRGRGCGSPPRPMAPPAGRAPRWRCCRRGGHRSACSPGATAARCCAPSSPRSGATTSAWSRSPTSSSAGTPA